MWLLQALGDQLGDVLDLERLLGPRDLAPEIDHGQAERTGHADHVGLGLEDLLDADHVHALLGRRLHPHLPAAPAAAQAALALAWQLDQSQARNRAGRFSWSVEDAIVAPEVTRVVEGHGLIRRLRRLDAAAPQDRKST